MHTKPNYVSKTEKRKHIWKIRVPRIGSSSIPSRPPRPWYTAVNLHVSEALIFATHAPLLIGQVTSSSVGKAFKLEMLNAIRSCIDQTGVYLTANQTTRTNYMQHGPWKAENRTADQGSWICSPRSSQRFTNPDHLYTSIRPLQVKQRR